MRAGPVTHIAGVIAGHRRGVTARWRRAAAGAAALVLPLTAIMLSAAPASAAVRYMVTHTIPGRRHPAVDSATHTAYVANGQTRAVSVIDEATNTVTHTIPVSGDPYAVAVDPTARTVYVTNDGGDTVWVINRPLTP